MIALLIRPRGLSEPKLEASESSTQVKEESNPQKLVIDKVGKVWRKLTRELGARAKPRVFSQHGQEIHLPVAETCIDVLDASQAYPLSLDSVTDPGPKDGKNEQ